MGDGAGQELGSAVTQGGVRPGALSALLEEIARAPEQSHGEDWDRALRPGLVVGKFELVRHLARVGGRGAPQRGAPAAHRRPSPAQALAAPQALFRDIPRDEK